MATINDDMERVARARGKAAEAGTEAKDAARDTAEQFGETAKHAAGDAIDRAKHTAEDFADRAREAGRDVSGKVQDVAGNFREAIERSVERQPVTTVLLAMAAGVLLGGLLRR